ncbi:hypothetical protein E2I00_015194 [Balaenoptera physalus]|uniref:Uncharacterized protein n=1 Tax=Balaenoptera physalus TaxID=9770 RepID=A0A6A1QF86_BALPH|nr:hypothetical protein E2I00_015194 [Balaenoptera physalus]
MVYDALDYLEKNEPKPRLQDMACVRRKRRPENSERNSRTERRKSGGLQRPMLVRATRGVKILP